MFDPIIKLLKQLSAETDPAQIALAVSFAMIFGFTPLWSLHNLLVLLLVSILRVNWSAFLGAWGLFSILAFALDPLFDIVGYQVLTMESMQDTWTAMYNNNLWYLENFNNTIVMGSLLVSLVCFIPVFFLSKWLIIRYRKNMVEYVKRSRLVKIIKVNKWLAPFFPDLGDLK